MARGVWTLGGNGEKIVKTTVLGLKESLPWALGFRVGVGKLFPIKSQIVNILDIVGHVCFLSHSLSFLKQPFKM